MNPGKAAWWLVASTSTVGLTVLIRKPRGSSTAAAMANASRAPFAVEDAAPVTIGSRASTPVVRVNEPPSATYGVPSWTMSIWASVLPSRPWTKSAWSSSASGSNGAFPIAAITASTVPTAANRAAMESGSVASTAGDDERDTATTSCPRSDRADTAAPPTSPVPMTRIFTNPSLFLVRPGARMTQAISSSAVATVCACSAASTRSRSRATMLSTSAAWMRRERSGLGRARWSSARAIVMWASMTGQSWSSRTLPEADQMARWNARCPSCRATGSGCRPWLRTHARPEEGVHPATGRVAGDRLDRQPVEGQPGLGEVADRGGVDLGDAQAPVRLRGEQALLRELGECFPDGRATHLQGAGQTDLGELLAGAQHAEDDAPPDLVDHRLPPRDRRCRQQPGRAPAAGSHSTSVSVMRERSTSIV